MKQVITIIDQYWSVAFFDFAKLETNFLKLMLNLHIGSIFTNSLRIQL